MTTAAFNRGSLPLLWRLVDPSASAHAPVLHPSLNPLLYIIYNVYISLRRLPRGSRPGLSLLELPRHDAPGETWGFPIALPEGHPGRVGPITTACVHMVRADCGIGRRLEGP
jgi:hypothetical protein